MEVWNGLELNAPEGVAAVGGKLFVNAAASTAISNTSAETDFSLNYTLPANSLKVGQVIRLVCRGTLNTHSTAPTLIMRVKFGATVLALTPTWTTIASTANRGWEITFDTIVTAIGTGGTVEALGVFTTSTGAAAAVTNQMLDLKNATPTSPVTVNTTVAQTLQVSAKFSVASVNNSMTMRQMIVEVLN